MSGPYVWNQICRRPKSFLSDWNYLYSNSNVHYSNTREDFDTNIDAIDIVEDQQTYTIQLTLNSSAIGFWSNEQTINASTTIGSYIAVHQHIYLQLKMLPQHFKRDTITGLVNASYPIQVLEIF